MRYVVRNVPMKVFVQAWVEISDDTPKDKVHDALANQLRDRNFAIKDEYDFEVETDVLDKGWELQYAPTHEQPLRADDEVDEHESYCDSIASRREDHQRDE